MDVEKMPKVPRLRFPEFSGEWDEIKLGNFLKQEVREIPVPSVPYLGLGVRSHFNGLMQRPDSDPQKIMMDKLFIVRPDDLVVNITFAWEGAVAIAEAKDNGGLVSHRFPTYRFQESIVIGNFFSQVFPRKRFKYELQLASPGGAGRNRVLSKKEFLDIKIFAPSVKEQKKIAAFLTAVDDKIAALQKKKKLLEKYKKGMVQAIFSKKIRFKDKNGKNYPGWQKKKFDDVLENVATKKFQIQNNQFLREGKFPVIDQGQTKIAGYSNESTKLFSKSPVIVFGDHTTFLKYIDFSFIVGADGTKILRSVKDDVLKYLYYYLEAHKLAAEGYKRHFSILRRIEFKIPRLEEQQQIADFLTAIDEKIELTERKLEQAQLFKKALLQQMFV